MQNYVLLLVAVWIYSKTEYVEDFTFDKNSL